MRLTPRSLITSPNNREDEELELFRKHSLAREISGKAALLGEREMEDTFTCDMCHQTFPKGWSDDEAAAELATVFGTTREKTPCAVVCDDCWNKLPKPNKSLHF